MLEIVDLVKTFNAGEPHEIQALKGITFEVKEGEFIVLLGTNGSGKSTLLGAIAGAFLPDSGVVLLDGHEITCMGEHERAQWIGRVFQNPFSGTAPDMSIAENLALAARRGKGRGLGWALGRSLLDEMAERVKGLGLGLEERLSEKIGGLSGGERQALTLLMATWLKPRLLLLDEHTAALDPRAASAVTSLSEKIIREANLTTLMVTHSMQQAVSLGERIVMLHRGSIIHDFSGDEKRCLKTQELMELFEEVRRRESLEQNNHHECLRG
jgi:putative tryptophan/tyrosine transport system ATP-binding protein